MRHKTALVSALSIVGVLMAGASALGANMGILSTNDGIGEITAVSNTVADSTTATTDAATTSTTTAGPDLVAYQINGVGVVTIAREGKRLTVDSAEVGAWSYTVDKQGKELSMSFENADRTVNFSAQVKNGEILVDVWEDNVVVETGSGSAGGSGGGAAAPDPVTSQTTVATTTSTHHDDDGQYDDDTQYDDDHDESYEDDDHEDSDHHENEDHEEDDHEGRGDDD